MDWPDVHAVHVLTGLSMGGSVAIPLGFLLGWLSGYRENEVRTRADERAGRCGRCHRPFDLSRDCHVSATQSSDPSQTMPLGAVEGPHEERSQRQ